MDGSPLTREGLKAVQKRCRAVKPTELDDDGWAPVVELIISRSDYQLLMHAAELAIVRGEILEGLVERVFLQSELLGRRAEKK
jgi:hypothetical protein